MGSEMCIRDSVNMTFYYHVDMSTRHFVTKLTCQHDHYSCQLTERLLHVVPDPAHLGVYAADLRPDLADNPVDGLPPLGRVTAGRAHYQVLEIVAQGEALKKKTFSILQKT